MHKTETATHGGAPLVGRTEASEQAGNNRGRPDLGGKGGGAVGGGLGDCGGGLRSALATQMAECGIPCCNVLAVRLVYLMGTAAVQHRLLPQLR